MSGHLSYDEGKKVVFKGLRLLGVITLIEVLLLLIGNGHIIDGFICKDYHVSCNDFTKSLYKTYFIIWVYAHEYEVKGLATMAVLLPTLFLVWAMIAFFSEGNKWFNYRNYVRTKDKTEATNSIQPQGGKWINHWKYRMYINHQFILEFEKKQ